MRLHQSVGETLTEKQSNQAGQKLTHKHDYYKKINIRLEKLRNKVQVEFRQLLDEGHLQTADDLRMILRPLRAQKLKSVGQASTVREVYEAWKKSYLQKKNRSLETEGKPEKAL